jgi:hypothetical protein
VGGKNSFRINGLLHWCARRAVAFVAISTGCRDHSRNKVHFDYKSALERRCIDGFEKPNAEVPFSTAGSLTSERDLLIIRKKPLSCAIHLIAHHQESAGSSRLRGGSAPGRVQVKAAHLHANDTARLSSAAVISPSRCRSILPRRCNAASSAA